MPVGDGSLCGCLNLKNIGMERALLRSSLAEMEQQEHPST